MSADPSSSTAQNAPGAKLDRLVEFVDFGPTVLNLAGISAPATCQGRPFLGQYSSNERDYLHGFRGRMDELLDEYRDALLHALERLATPGTVIVDKTGTLTEGHPSVTAIVAAAGFDDAELLRLAAGVERASEHPLARAVMAAAAARDVAVPEVNGFDSPSGKGAIGAVDGRQITLGNAGFLAERGIGTAIHYPAPVHRQPGYVRLCDLTSDPLAGTDALAPQILSLPMHPLLQEDEVTRVVEALGAAAAAGIT